MRIRTFFLAAALVLVLNARYSTAEWVHQRYNPNYNFSPYDQMTSDPSLPMGYMEWTSWEGQEPCFILLSDPDESNNQSCNPYSYSPVALDEYLWNLQQAHYVNWDSTAGYWVFGDTTRFCYAHEFPSDGIYNYSYGLDTNSPYFYGVESYAWADAQTVTNWGNVTEDATAAAYGNGKFRMDIIWQGQGAPTTRNVSYRFVGWAQDQVHTRCRSKSASLYVPVDPWVVNGYRAFHTISSASTNNEMSCSLAHSLQPNQYVSQMTLGFPINLETTGMCELGNTSTVRTEGNCSEIYQGEYMGTSNGVLDTTTHPEESFDFDDNKIGNYSEYHDSNNPINISIQSNSAANTDLGFWGSVEYTIRSGDHLSDCTNSNLILNWECTAEAEAYAEAGLNGWAHADAVSRCIIELVECND